MPSPAIMVLRFIPLEKAHQLGLFAAPAGGGGGHQKVGVKSHIAVNPGGTGVHIVKEHEREVAKAKEEEKPTPLPVPPEVKPAVSEPATVNEGADATAVPGVTEQAIDTASDVSSIAISREHLDLVRRKAQELGLEVEEHPATAAEVLYHWATPLEERDEETVARAAETAKGLVHLTITAPKSKESIVGTAERIEGEQPYLREFGERGTAWDGDRIKSFSFRHCADCGREIERKFAYLVRTPDGKIRQVGGTCAEHLNLANKLRDMLAKFEELANTIRSIGGPDDGEGGGGGGGVSDLVDPVAMFRVALATLQTRGFHSAKAYHEAQDAGKQAQEPTSWSVRKYFATQKALARGQTVGKHAREEYERIRANVPTIAPHARKLHEQALADAEAKLQAGGGAMEHNAHVALKTGSKKLAGFSTFAAWKQLQEHRRAMATHPPKPYVRETIAEKMALPMEELRAGLQGDEKVLAAIAKSKDTGKALPKYAASALETFVPGKWRVEDVREFDSQFGVSQKVRLRRESDGAGIEWSTSGGANGVRHGGVSFDLGEASAEEKERAAASRTYAKAPGEKLRDAVERDVRSMGLTTDPFSRRLQPGDVVRVHSAGDYKPTDRQAPGDDRTPEERAEGKAKAAEGLQRRAATRMARLNIAHVDPAEQWSPAQRTAVDRAVEAIDTYDREADEHYAATERANKQIEDLKDHPGREAYRKAADEVYDRANQRPEVRAAREAYDQAYNASGQAYREMRDVQHKHGYRPNPESDAASERHRLATEAYDAARKHLDAARDAAHAEEKAKTPVAPWQDPMETPEGIAKRDAIHASEEARGKAWGKRVEELAKNVETAREAAVEEGVFPHHIDDHIMRRVYDRHAPKLRKANVRFLVRMQIPLVKGTGKQVNLLTGKDEHGAATRRVRIAAHTRIVGGKVEVVQAHEREVEVPAVHLPGPVSSALRKGTGMPMGMMKPAQPEASAVPPSTRVKYRHPESGEERDGHVHAGGSKGLTVVDEETGQAHKVPHGHYVVHPDEDGTPASKAKQQAAAEAQAQAAKEKPAEDPRAVAQQKHDAEATHGKLRELAHELPAALAEARRDLRMGTGSRAAQAAAAALFQAQAGQPLRKVSDLKLDGKTVKCHDAEVEDEALATYLLALVKMKKPAMNVVDNAEQRACDYLNGHIGDAEVTPDDLRQLAATDKWTAAAGKLGKVKDDADHAEHVKQAARAADVHPKDVDPVSIAAHRRGVRRKGDASLGEHLDAVHKADPNDMRRAAPKEVA